MSPIVEYPLNLAMGHATANAQDVPHMSRTHQYRKVMKPLLERKRRARINQCLDELKDLMVYALQSEGENVSKLEKADILELTVRHMQKLKRQHMLQANPALDVDRYRAGFTACASEVSRVLSSVPGVTIAVGTQLMSHLGASMNAIDRLAAASTSPLSVHAISSTSASRVSLSAMSPASDGGYTSDGRESSSPISVGSAASPPPHKQGEPVWRPF